MVARPRFKNAMTTTTTVSEQDRFASVLIERGAPSLAHGAADELAAKRPDLALQFGANAVTTWRELLVAQLRELAAAIAFARPTDFGHQVAWAKIAFAARAFPADFLPECLKVLRSTLEREISAPSSARFAPYFAAADAAIAGEPLDGDHAPRAIRHPVLARYLKHLLDGDRRAATRSLTDAVRAGEIALPQAYVDVCLAAQREIGLLWHRNEISIAVEHFVTAAAQSTMAELFALGVPAPPLGKTLLAASVAGDRHDIGLRCTTDLLALDGWKSIFLGADVPVNDIAAGVDEYAVDLVLLSATLAVHRKGVAEAIARIRKDSDRVLPVLVGGGAFDGDDSLWRSVGADGYAKSPGEVNGIARQLVGIPRA
jgi:MerR family transcriptional regulator, light-induced transcriptional regulator